MLHSKEWAIAPNDRELVVGSSGMVYWKAIGKSRHGNQIRINREGLKMSLACEEEVHEQEPASLTFPSPCL